MKMLIAYDIPKDKTRNKVSDILLGYGYRVNFSVFECELNTTALKKLKQELLEMINPKTDSIRFYYLCQNCIDKSFELAPKPRNVFENKPLEF